MGKKNSLPSRYFLQSSLLCQSSASFRAHYSVRVALPSELITLSEQHFLQSSLFCQSSASFRAHYSVRVALHSELITLSEQHFLQSSLLCQSSASFRAHYSVRVAHSSELITLPGQSFLKSSLLCQNRASFRAQQHCSVNMFDSWFFYISSKRIQCTPGTALILQFNTGNPRYMSLLFRIFFDICKFHFCSKT